MQSFVLLKSEGMPGEEKQNICPDLESIKKYKKNIDRVTSCHYTGFAKGDKLSLGYVPLKANSLPKMRKDKSLQNVSREEGCRRRDF